MRERVPAQVAVSPEHFVARVTLVRLVVGVREQMRLEVAALVEATFAYRTLVRGLFQMEDLVHGQRARLTESFAAFRTLEWFLLGMNIPETIAAIAFSIMSSTNVNNVITYDVTWEDKSGTR